jgi:hypothetical protein
VLSFHNFALAVSLAGFDNLQRTICFQKSGFWNRWYLSVNQCQFQGCGSGAGLGRIRIRMSCWIRIQASELHDKFEKIFKNIFENGVSAIFVSFLS